MGTFLGLGWLVWVKLNSNRFEAAKKEVWDKKGAAFFRLGWVKLKCDGF